MRPHRLPHHAEGLLGRRRQGHPEGAPKLKRRLETETGSQHRHWCMPKKEGVQHPDWLAQKGANAAPIGITHDGQRFHVCRSHLQAGASCLFFTHCFTHGSACAVAAQVSNEADVRHMFGQVQGEVPGSPVFAMALAPQSRHLEVQLICDMCVPSDNRADRAVVFETRFPAAATPRQHRSNLSNSHLSGCHCAAQR